MRDYYHNNPYTLDLYAQLQAQYSVESTNMKMSEWITKHTKHKGRPFSFERYPYQKEVVDDEHPNQVGVKPSQVGWSEIYHRWSLAFLKRNPATKGIYAYPDDAMWKKNAQTRMLPLANNNDIFNEGYSHKTVRSVSLIQIGDSFCYVTGSKEGDVTSTDADFVIVDEYDLHDPGMATKFRSRVLNSDWKIIRNFSTPTYTGFGVDQSYESSDQTSYMYKCRSCNTYQFPMFNLRSVAIPGLSGDINDILEIDQGMIERYNLNLKEAYVCCIKCSNRLDLTDTSRREWVSKYPSRTHLRGRKINMFSVSTRPPVDIFTELFEYRLKDNMRGFKNTVTGEPEDSSSNRISEEDILYCIKTGQHLRANPRTDIPAWVGIDMGHTCHITIGLGYTPDACEVVEMLTCPLNRIVDMAVQICGEYNVLGGLCDRHPESQTANDIRDATNGIILPCEYRGSKTIGLVEDEFKELSHIQCDRTSLLDQVKRVVTKRQITFAGFGPHESVIKLHLRNMVREESPETPATWKKLDSQDHFFHSTGFMLRSMEVREVVQEKRGVPQTSLLIAGAQVGGYNSDIYGNTTSKSNKGYSQWQTSFLGL